MQYPSQEAHDAHSASTLLSCFPFQVVVNLTSIPVFAIMRTLASMHTLCFSLPLAKVYVLVAHCFFLFCLVACLSSPAPERYNLLEAEVCGPRMANFLGVILPWLICVPFYTGSGFTNVVNWSDLLSLARSLDMHALHQRDGGTTQATHTLSAFFWCIILQSHSLCSCFFSVSCLMRCVGVASFSTRR
jgi:hypothetical protein